MLESRIFRRNRYIRVSDLAKIKIMNNSFSNILFSIWLFQILTSANLKFKKARIKFESSPIWFRWEDFPVDSNQNVQVELETEISSIQTQDESFRFDQSQKTFPSSSGVFRAWEFPYFQETSSCDERNYRTTSNVNEYEYSKDRREEDLSMESIDRSDSEYGNLLFYFLE